MPPPPWELLMTDKPSIRDGLQLKLLDSAPLQFAVLTLLSVRSTLSRGNAAGVAPSVHGYSPSGTNTPFDTTVIPAPSYAPRRVGSCSCSARLPFSPRSEEHTSELQSHSDLVCRLLLEKKNTMR